MLTRDYSQTGGRANSMMGNAKEMAGDIVGSNSMKKDGKRTPRARRRRGLYNQVAGKVNNVIGSMMGKAQEIAGQAKKEANKPV
ncbi:hypothetical protein B0H13DRAFT_2369723 [Mycena leptocephala]|nr:hypothetical protein B0H13DRAFT_2369723 [Mycena leptocephala]